MITPRVDIHTNWVIRGFILGLTILYLGPFPFLHDLVGDSATVLSVLPVAVTGCDVYMSKPINIRELWARVEAFVPAPQ